jgi:hypothetical protein
VINSPNQGEKEEEGVLVKAAAAAARQGERQMS